MPVRKLSRSSPSIMRPLPRRSGTSERRVGQSIAQAFHGFFGTALTLIGAATLAAAIFEHYGVRPKWLTHWRVKDLGAFELADPAAWGVAPTVKVRGARGRRWPGGEHLFSAFAIILFILWWTGVIHFAPFTYIELRGPDATVTGAPIWTTLYGAILLYAVAQLAVDLASIARPHAVRMRAAARLIIAGVGLWLTWVILEAGHWFTLIRGEETARIAGGWDLLDVDRLRTLGEGTRDLAGVAGALSLVMTWVLAISAISLVCSILLNLWRLMRRDTPPRT